MWGGVDWWGVWRMPFAGDVLLEWPSNCSTSMKICVVEVSYLLDFLAGSWKIFKSWNIFFEYTIIIRNLQKKCVTASKLKKGDLGAIYMRTEAG